MPRTTAMPGTIPHSVLSTVLDLCTPAIRGEDDDFSFLPYMYTAPPCVYKRGRRALSYRRSSGETLHSASLTRAHTLFGAPILALASINSSSSRDLRAFLPLSPRLYPLLQALRSKIVQCTHTPFCWMYGPAAGTRINLCVTVLPLASTIWD